MSDPHALKELEERIKPNLGNSALWEVYRSEVEALRKLSDNDLVHIHRVDPSRGAAAELTRRSMEATRALNLSLESADNRIYWLTVVLTLYTVALLIATVVLLLKTR